MSANNAKVQAVIETTFNSAINKLAANEAGNCYSDLYVQVDAESGELLIYDEEDVLVEKTIIFDWVNTACDDDQLLNSCCNLKAVLAVLVTKKVFDNPCFLKPFSVSLTDEDFSVIEELLFLDDENLRLDDPLLKIWMHDWIDF